MVYSNWHLAITLIAGLLDGFALSALYRGRSSMFHKVSWSIVVVLLPFAGVLLYLCFGRSRRDAQMMV